jgi:hypothetical protein
MMKMITYETAIPTAIPKNALIMPGPRRLATI